MSISQKAKDYSAGAACGTAVAAILAGVFYDFDVISLWLLALVPFGIKWYRRWAEERRKHRLLSEFKDALSYVKNALDAGDSAENAFAAAVTPLKKMYGTDAYITGSFVGICRKVRNGMTLEQAFSEFAEDTKLKDILDFADIFPVLKRTGGDMNSAISREIKNLSDKQNLAREIHIVTAGKKNEFNVMCIVPVAMIVYLRISSGDMMKSLYHNAAGYMFMTIMIILYAACIGGGRWILKKHLG